MNDLDHIIARKNALTKNVDDWPQHIRNFSDSLLAINIFRDPTGLFEMTESVISEAVSDDGLGDEYMLSMLIRSAASSPLQFNLGNGTFLRGNEPGTFVFGNLRTQQYVRGIGPFHSVSFHVNVDTLKQRIRELTGKSLSLDPLHSNVFHDETLEVLIKQLLSICQAGQHRTPRAGSTRIDGLVDQICHRLLHNAGHKVSEPSTEDRLQPRSIKQVLEYIDSSLGSELDRDSLAKIAGVSPCHFSRLFRQSVGMTPKQYILKARIERVKNLLDSQNDLLLKEIAESLGFTDQAHLSREFTRQVGVPPGAYRKFR